MGKKGKSSRRVTRSATAASAPVPVPTARPDPAPDPVINRMFPGNLSYRDGTKRLQPSFFQCFEKRFADASPSAILKQSSLISLLDEYFWDGDFQHDLDDITELIYGEFEEIDIIQNCIDYIYDKQQFCRRLKRRIHQITKSPALFGDVVHLRTEITNMYTLLESKLDWFENVIRYTKKWYPDLKSPDSHCLSKSDTNHTSSRSDVDSDNEEARETYWSSREGHSYDPVYDDQEVLTDGVLNRVRMFSDLTENEDTGTTKNSELEPASATKSESSTNEETACPQDDDTSTRSGVSNDLEYPHEEEDPRNHESISVLSYKLPADNSALAFLHSDLGGSYGHDNYDEFNDDNRIQYAEFHYHWYENNLSKHDMCYRDVSEYNVLSYFAENVANWLKSNNHNHIYTTSAIVA